MTTAYPGIITARVLADRAHISDHELARDIAETELEITQYRETLMERSWGFSLVLAHIDEAEMERIVERIAPTELPRFTAVLEGYRDDLIAINRMADESPHAVSPKEMS